MIEIRITDPETTDRGALRAIANVLLSFAGDKPGTVTETTTRTTSVTKPGTAVASFQTPDNTTVSAIAPEDNPAAGTEIDGIPDAATVGFGVGVVLGCEAGATVTDIDATVVGFGQAPLPPGGIDPNARPAVAHDGTQAHSAGQTSVSTQVAPPPVPGNTVANATPPAPPGVVVDADGLPWNERIHAGTKTQNKDGRWKKKKGVDDATVAAVEAELRQVLAIPGAAPANPLAQFKTAAELGMTTAAASIPTPPVPGATAGNVPPVPGILSASSATLAPPANAGSPGTAATVAVHSAAPANQVASNVPTITFAQLLPMVTAATTAGTLTQARVIEVVGALGFPNLPSLATRPDLIATVHAQLFPQ